MDASRQQTELGQIAAQRLFGKAEEQADAFQSLLGSWAVAGSFFVPFGYYREGLENVARMPMSIPTAGGTRNGGLPIEGYDEMSVGEISDRLDSLSGEELERIGDYERRNKNRDTLIERLDRKIKANS